MLDVVLGFLRDEINAFLAARTGSEAIQVTLSRVVSDQGKYAIPDDSIGLTLINLEEERVVRAQLPTQTLVNGQRVLQEPELKLNLHVLFAPNFKVYEEGLKALSNILLYFQSHPTFTATTYPALDARVERLNAELLSLTYEQLNQLWAFVGARQLPSAVYRLRLVVLQDLEFATAGPPITSVVGTLHGKSPVSAVAP
ncbi:MAG TPA: DUF4255 domain-containing protein [Longimicrobiales bacterium]